MADKAKEMIEQMQIPEKPDPGKSQIMEAIREGFEAIKEGVDVVIERTDKFLGPSGKAWLANGLDELRQAFTPGIEQVQPGNNPGLWGTITGIEAAHDRGVYAPVPEQAVIDQEQTKEHAHEQERTR